MNFLQDLNEAQRKAAEHIEGPLMVIAGAGSGKTRVLTFRIANLLESGVESYNILALTFTNKAAREMKARITSIVGNEVAANLWMGTFHSIFARILRMEADKIGYPRNFTIYDSTDSKSMIKRIIKEMKLDDKVYKPGLVYNRISAAKNNLLSPQAYQDNPTISKEDSYAKKPLIGEIYEKYQNRCFRSGAMDFDDLLFQTNLLLRDSPEALLKYQEKFKFILVDEYQDTNFSQSIILKRLAARYENICVVGDDAQSIYAFRGANIQNILNFKRTYPDAVTYKLEQNYRSTQTIVNAANSIIKKNKEQLDKKVWTSNHEGPKIKLLKANSDNEEGRAVAGEIFQISNEEKASFQSFAILYRTNAQSRAMEEALRKIDIPYRIFGGTSFYQRKEIKDILAYFRVIINHNDEEAVKRIINYPKRAIGQTTVDKVTVYANDKQLSFWEVISSIRTHHTGISASSATKISEFVDMIRSFEAQIEVLNAFDLASAIASSSRILHELYQDKSIEGVSRYENIQELLAGIKEFTESAPEGEQRHLPDFMEDVALLTDQDDEKDKDPNKVSLMTVHAAKGLEFPYVFIVGLEENLFPSQLSTSSRSDLEEERRLFYVALTRAEKKAILSYALRRYRWGNLIYSDPSRFISEIDEHFIEASTLRKRPDQNKQTTPSFQKPRNLVSLKSPSRTNAPAPPTNNANIKEGDLVSHHRFGKGTIVKLSGEPGNLKANVNFDGVGEKQLLLKFAKLELIQSS